VEIVSIDITQKHHAEQAMRESEQKYRMLVENTNDIAYSIDAEGSLMFLGPQVRRYGIDPEDVVSGGFLEFVYPQDRAQLQKDMERTLTTGEEFPSEFRLLDRQGNVHWLEEEGKALRDESGRVIGISGMLRDITERRQAQEALKASEERWRSLVENAPNIIIIVDREGIIQFINHTVPGLTVEETIGTNQYDYIDPEYRNAVRESIEHVFTTGEPVKYRIRGVGPEGTMSWYETNVSPVKSGDEVVAATLIVTDITDRMQAEIALRESEERYKLLAENATDVIWTMDLNLRQTYVSPSVQALRGYTPEEALTQSIGFFRACEEAVRRRDG
jgi:PAS domain S-box-containing protein